MRVLFLDIDGVLVNRKSLRALRSLPQGMEGRASAPHVADPDCVAALNSIPDVHLVISSTWRLLWNMADLRGIIAGWGVTHPVIDKTPRLERKEGGIYVSPPRGTEIQKWLDGYDREPIDSFVILDDDSDMGELEPFLILTNFQSGLTLQDAERATATLARVVE